MHARQLVPRSLATVVGVGGVVIALVWAYRVMRVVMAARGGPVDSELIQVAILGGMACLVLYGAFGLLAGPRLAILAWPAVFLSGAWLFVTDAYRPPATAIGDSSGIWWADGVLFGVLGAGVLIPLLAVPRWRRMLWSDGSDGPTFNLRGRRSSPQPRNIDELFANLAGQRPQVSSGQVYSAILHLLVIVAALWLGIASFGWITA